MAATIRAGDLALSAAVASASARCRHRVSVLHGRHRFFTGLPIGIEQSRCEYSSANATAVVRCSALSSDNSDDGGNERRPASPFGLFSSLSARDPELRFSSSGRNDPGEEDEGAPMFRSAGSRSALSRPSIPGRFSKYSKPERPERPKRSSSAIPSNSRAFSTGTEPQGSASGPAPSLQWSGQDSEENAQSDSSSTVHWSRQHLVQARSAPVIPPPTTHLGRKHLELPAPRNPNRLHADMYGPRRFHPRGPLEERPTYDLPFEFQYTYSEIPKAEPIAQRGPQFSPFGPDSMPRPWTGKAPLPKSKKKKHEIDSFNPPPPNLRNVKPVEAAGPFPRGQRPILALAREDIMGEPLSQDEIKELVEACNKENRQLNIGRDGLTHNMLDVIHNHWKRRRVIKFKCKGVPTLDMDNLCFHLEDKTGGKIIYRQGGAVYMFRGRNYNPKYRPTIPLMLWKPPVPVYPRLIQQCPPGLTMEQAEALRRRGRRVKSLCSLSRNGVYLNLVKDVKDAFEVDELVKLDCRGMNPNDHRKIGARLKEMLGIVLLSFEGEQVLMWRGPPKPTADEEALQEFISESAAEASKELAEEDLDTDSTQDQEKSDADSTSDHGKSNSDSTSDQGKSNSDSTSDQEMPEDADSTSDQEKPTQTPAQLRAAQQLDELWERAVNFGMVVNLDESQLDPDTIKAIAGAPVRLNRSSAEEEQEEEAERAAMEQEKRAKFLEEKYDRLDKVLTTTVKPPPVGVLPVDELAKLLASPK